MAEREETLNIVGALSHANAASNGLITPETSRFLREILQKALRNPVGVAPRWVAEAWALLANILVNDYLHSWNHAGRVELNEAEEAMENALAIDPQLALAHHSNGLIHRARGDHQAALDAFTQAVQFDPRFARALAQQANELTLLGRPQEALPRVEEAIKLDPHDPALGIFYWVKGRAHFFAGQYKEAIPEIRRAPSNRLVQLALPG
jgi:tetratricopeptide (TPR) repeat protein